MNKCFQRHWMVILALIALLPVSGRTDWTHGNYTYTTPTDVLEASGNYVVGGIGPNGGDVQALTPSSGSGSAIRIRY